MDVSNTITLVVCVLAGLMLQTECACFAKSGCVHSGHHVSPGETYKSTKDCLSCTCGDNQTLHCCSIGGYIADHPPECKVVKEGCFEKAVLISDETIACTGPVSMIGR